MGKLFKLKEWLTIPEAAKHLSVLFGEEVAESDVLRLGLDGHLKLSVNFVNEVLAYTGKVVPISEARVVEGLPITDALRKSFAERNGLESSLGEQLTENSDTKYFVMLGYQLNDKQIVQFDYGKKYLRAVWDLCMLEGEKHDVEERYYEEIGAPFVDRWSLDGVLVTRSDGYIYRLAYELEKPNKEIFDKNTEIFQANLMKGGNGDETETKRMVEEHAQYRKKLWEDKTPRFGTASHLPDDSILVVRTEALREFEHSMKDSPSGTAKVSDNSLLSTIAALLATYPVSKQPSGKDLERAAESIGVLISDDTIRKALDAARELSPSLKKSA